MSATDRAKELLSAVHQSGECTGVDAPRNECPSCNADAAGNKILSMGEDTLRVAIGLVEALEAGNVVRSDEDADLCDTYHFARPDPDKPCGRCRPCRAGKALDEWEKLLL